MNTAAPLGQLLLKGIRAQEAASAKRVSIKDGDAIPAGAKIVDHSVCWGAGGRCKYAVLPCRWTIVELAHKTIPEQFAG